MKVTEFSLRNPLYAGLIATALAIFGIYAYLTLSISIVPNITQPAAIVITTDPGADPATIETQVTRPIEDALASLQNIKSLTSTSSQGLSLVNVNFTAGVNTDLISVDVDQALNSVRGTLPATATQPAVAKLNTNSALPILKVVLYGPQPLEEIEAVAENQVQRAFQSVEGVGAVGLSGGPMREIWVQVNLTALQSYGLGLNTVQQALQSNQLSQPAGSLIETGSDVNVRLNSQAADPRQLGDIVVAEIAGSSSRTSSPIRVNDVATISDMHAPTTTIDRYNGTPAVTLSITKLANANTIAVSRGIQQQMAALQPLLPPGMRLEVVTDLATYTQQSFNTIQRTLVEAVLLTGLILLVFLHTWRSTLIVLVAIPTSVLTTLGLMALLGLNLNLFSMLALTLSIGILVDDSIVVIENISRHLDLGEPPILAAIAGRNEIGLAAITITLVDVVVYVPIALISGIGGQILRPFALVIAAATLTSLVVSFTLTPLLASRYLAFQAAITRQCGLLSVFGQWWDVQFMRLERGYCALLQATLTGRLPPSRRGPGLRWLAIVIGFASLAAGLAVLRTGRIGVDVFPSGDQSEIDITLTMPPSTDIATTDSIVQQLESAVRAYPEVNRVYSHTGSAGGPAASASGAGGGRDTSQLTVVLVPPNQRTRTAADLASLMRQQLGATLPGASLRTALPNPFGFGGFGGQAMQVTIDGSDPDTLNELVSEATQAIKQVPGVVDVSNSNQHVFSEYDVNIDPNRAADAGVSAQMAGTALATAVAGQKVSKFQKPGQPNVDIRLIADDAFRASPDNLASLPLVTTNDTVVRLNQIATITRATTPTQIAHDNRLRSVTVSASAAGGYSVGTVQSALQQRLAGMRVPPGYSISYTGQAATGAQTFGDIVYALGAALVLMYVLMALLFDSLTLPLAVLMSVPLAVVGAVGAMAITATNFTLFSLLGVTLLMGLVGKNAILLVDYTHTLRKRGANRLEALLEAGPTRLRPILMTTLSVVFALLPVASGIEVGSELLKAAAVVLIGGLVTSTPLTLLFIPAMYTVFDDLESAIKRLTHRLGQPRRLEPVEVAILRGQPVDASLNRPGASC
jgi:hydrophobic/amphiphilic exporter-1 (mainly G- bacteria), HAE1 family